MPAPLTKKQQARLICIGAMITCGLIVLSSPSGLATIPAKIAFYIMISNAIGLVMIR